MASRSCSTVGWSAVRAGTGRAARVSACAQMQFAASCGLWFGPARNLSQGTSHLSKPPRDWSRRIRSQLDPSAAGIACLPKARAASCAKDENSDRLAGQNRAADRSSSTRRQSGAIAFFRRGSRCAARRGACLLDSRSRGNGSDESAAGRLATFKWRKLMQTARHSWLHALVASAFLLGSVARAPRPKTRSKSESCTRCRARWRSARPS